MSTIENNVLLQKKDNNGNEEIIYPITKKENILDFNEIEIYINQQIENATKYKKGDIIHFRCYTGLATTGGQTLNQGKRLYFSVHIPKILSNITTANMSFEGIQIRGTNGVVGVEDRVFMFDELNPSFKLTLTTENLIFVRMDFTAEAISTYLTNAGNTYLFWVEFSGLEFTLN